MLCSALFFLLCACGSQPVQQVVTEPLDVETVPETSVSFLELAANSSGYQAQKYLVLAFKQAVLESDSITACLLYTSPSPRD